MVTSRKLTLWKLDEGCFLTGDLTKVLSIVLQFRQCSWAKSVDLNPRLGQAKKGLKINSDQIELFETNVKEADVPYFTIEKDEDGDLMNFDYGLLFSRKKRGVCVEGLLDYETGGIMELDSKHQKVCKILGW